MKQRFLSLFLLLLSVAASPAIIWDSSKYQCALEYPEAEWVQLPVESNRDGNLILAITSKAQKSTVWLFVTSRLPINTVKHQGIPPRIAAMLENKGFNVMSDATLMTQNGDDFMQMVATGKTSDGNSKVAVARVGMRNQQLYYLITTGEGDKSRVEEGALLKVADTFRFVHESAVVNMADVLVPKYKLAMFISLGAFGALIFFYAAMLFRTRYRVEN